MSLKRKASDNNSEKIKSNDDQNNKRMRVKPLDGINGVGFQLLRTFYLARLKAPKNKRSPLKFRQIIKFLELILMDYSVHNTLWMQIKNKNSLKKSCIIIVENVGVGDIQTLKSFSDGEPFEKAPGQYNVLGTIKEDAKDLFKKQELLLEIANDNDKNPLSFLSYADFQKKNDASDSKKLCKNSIFEKNSVQDEEITIEKDLSVTDFNKLSSLTDEMKAKLLKQLDYDKFDRTKLLLNSLEQIKHYPFHNVPEISSDAMVIPTKKKYTEVTAKSPMFAIDCEMVQTTKEVNALGEVSVVDENLNVIYHTTVSPPDPVTDYRTRYSGLTNKSFNEDSKDLRRVQKDLRKLLPSDAIIVGHSLHSDLLSLKLCHPYCIDTSVIYNLQRDFRRPSRLKILVGLFLRISIQSCERIGHDPSEDAASAMLLVKLKLSKDIKFGDRFTSWTYPFPDNALKVIENQTKNEESHRKRLRARGKLIHECSSLFEALYKDNVVTNLILGSNIKESHKIYLETYNHTLYERSSNKKVFKKAMKVLETENSAICHVKAKNAQELSEIDKCIGDFRNSIEENSVIVVIFTGSNSFKNTNGILSIFVKTPINN